MIESFAAQGRAISALAAMTQVFGDLPVAYITLYRSSGEGSLAVETPAGFEEWRQALGIPSQDVELVTHEGGSWLAASGTWHGAHFELACHGIPAVAPRDEKDGGDR